LNLSTVSKFFIALILGLLTVFVIDPLDPSTVSTPFCLGIILMGLSLRQSTSLVIAVSLLYTVLTAIALINFHHYHDAHVRVSPHPYFWLFQRMGTFLVLCGMACYLAHYRTDTERILSRLRTILSKLPVPVILSDSSGNIVYANDAVTSVLHQTPVQITGKSYFNYFRTERMKGRSVRAYFETFESDTNGIYQLDVGSFENAKKMNSQLICLGTGRNRVMITVLQNGEKIFDPAVLASQGAPLQAHSNPHPQ
jgi:PAS domain-containing protein